jgi:hypothetical protein
VISFFIKGESIFVSLPFCFFMDFTIYAIRVDQPWVAVLAR